MMLRKDCFSRLTVFIRFSSEQFTGITAFKITFCILTTTKKNMEYESFFKIL